MESKAAKGHVKVKAQGVEAKKARMALGWHQAGTFGWSWQPFCPGSGSRRLLPHIYVLWSEDFNRFQVRKGL